MTNFRITLTSDTICPWCYVAKKYLERVIAAYKDAHPESRDTFETVWAPFQLNPQAPKPGMDKRKYYEMRFGLARAANMYPGLVETGKRVGIDFKFGGKTGNTRDSHRILALALSHGADTQERVVEALSSAYFEHEQDITDYRVLKAAGLKAGLTAVELDEWLESDKGGDQIDREVKEAQRKGITGVPSIKVQEYEVGGTKTAEEWIKLFETVKSIEGAR